MCCRPMIGSGVAPNCMGRCGFCRCGFEGGSSTYCTHHPHLSHNSYYMVLELTLMMILSVSGMVCNQLPESSYKTRLCASKVECQLEDCNMMMIRLITSPDSMTRWTTHKWRSPSFHCFVIKDDAAPPNLTPWLRPEWKTVVINPGQNIENYQWKNQTVSICACLIVVVRWVWCGEPPVYIAEYLAVFHVF